MGGAKKPVRLMPTMGESMTGIPAHHYREKARSALAARGLYPPQGRLHGLMYPIMFAAGLWIGVGLAGVSQWIVAGLAILVFIGCVYVGFRQDDEYEQRVVDAALQLEQEP